MEGQEGTSNYEQRRECIAACLKDEWYTSDDVSKVRRQHPNKRDAFLATQILLYCMQDMPITVAGCASFCDSPAILDAQTLGCAHVSNWVRQDDGMLHGSPACGRISLLCSQLGQGYCQTGTSQTDPVFGVPVTACQAEAMHQTANRMCHGVCCRLRFLQACKGIPGKVAQELGHSEKLCSPVRDLLRR